MQADILGLPVRTIPIQEKSATGAAMIAGIGRGIFESFEDACQRIIVPGECTTPLPAHIQQYDEVYQVYHSLYPRLREAFTANTKYS